MTHFFQVDDGCVSIQLLEDVISAGVFSQLRYRPVFVGCVAERDSAGRTRSRACRRELVGLELALFRLRTILRLTNPLNAKGALFHHALSAHRYIGIQLPVERLWEGVLWPRRLSVTEPVEVTNLVGTVVRAVASTDATIVDLHVQTVG